MCVVSHTHCVVYICILLIAYRVINLVHEATPNFSMLHMEKSEIQIAP